MPQTKEYAKLGRTTYVAALYGDDGNDPYRADLRRCEFTSKAEAERWVKEWLPKWQKAKAPEFSVHGEIREGVYKDNSFTDDEYGHICDAEWEPTDVRAYCQLVDGLPDVEWEE